ncbi:kinase-like domain-containing protein [Immersiella caudata]|uniref:Kinase-like domain-containing protein n=1 Tax=Immersiella caudata TaxID=314043 RepID=A0AA40C0M7_9PEZI|nr:kinase-like domain-containing protein [Immersiella caudata]
MARLLSADAVLLGRLSSYNIGQELHRAADEGAVYLARNRGGENCIVKSIRGHWRLRNEADILKRYQSKTPFFRPLVDDIHTPADPPSIVLRYLDSDVLTESNKKRLSRPEIKQVARCVLEVLRLLHRDGMVHTDIKLDNIFVNDGQGDQRFSDIQLGDYGGVVSQDSSFAKEGHVIGAAFTRSPEATFQLPWGTATGIWSFGTAMLSLVFGGGYHLFNPKIEKVEPGSDEYEFTVLKRMHRFFGPYPQSYQDFKDEDTMTIINFINAQGPPAKPFHRVGPREVPPADIEFLLKIMKLDPRDRPTAEELLADMWFTEESQDTRDPLPGEELRSETKQHGEEEAGA